MSKVIFYIILLISPITLLVGSDSSGDLVKIKPGSMTFIGRASFSYFDILNKKTIVENNYYYRLGNSVSVPRSDKHDRPEKTDIVYYRSTYFNGRRDSKLSSQELEDPYELSSSFEADLLYCEYDENLNAFIILELEKDTNGE